MVGLVSRGSTSHSCRTYTCSCSKMQLTNFDKDVTLFNYFKKTLVMLKICFSSSKSLCKRSSPNNLLIHKIYLLKRIYDLQVSLKHCVLRLNNYSKIVCETFLCGKILFTSNKGICFIVEKKKKKKKIFG